MNFTHAVLTAVLSSLITSVMLVAVLLPAARAHMARKLARERTTFARADRATWRRVDPMLVGAAEGSLAHIAGVVLQHTPLALHTQFRMREVNDLNIGNVRVSFEVGTRYHKTEES